jgi:hypothetical protein
MRAFLKRLGARIGTFSVSECQFALAHGVAQKAPRAPTSCLALKSLEHSLHIGFLVVVLASFGGKKCFKSRPCF